MAPRDTVLYFGRYTPLPEIRTTMLRRAGYEVLSVAKREDAMLALQQQKFSVLILDEALSHEERAAAGSASKRAGTLVLGIHRGEREPHEDVNQGSLEKPGEFMHTVSRLVLQSHGHHEVSGEFVAYVDSSRRYLFVTEPVCGLLGYTCDQLIGRRIEDVTMPGTADTERLFEQYVKNGGQNGTYVLRHKKGHAVPIAYKAHVLGDGCLAAEWEVIPVAENVR